jgi:membrane protease YdiL (CAAX protease family)
MGATAFGLSLASPDFRPDFATADDKLSIALAGIVLGLMVGVFEELGWTGFALPRLRRLLPYRVLMVWVYDRTESLLLAILMHAPISATAFILASVGSEATSGIPLVIPTLVWSAAFWAIVGGVAWANGGHISRR